MEITNVLAEKSPIRAEALQRWIVFQPRHEWRHPQRPVLQTLTSYVLVSDDQVSDNQYPPLFPYTHERPCTHISGRYPIDFFTRPLPWALPWPSVAQYLINGDRATIYYG